MIVLFSVKNKTLQGQKILYVSRHYFLDVLEFNLLQKWAIKFFSFQMHSCDRLKKQKLVVTLQLPRRGIILLPVLCLSSFFLWVVFLQPGHDFQSCVSLCGSLPFPFCLISEKKLYRNLGAIAKKQSSAGPPSENMAHITLTVLTAVLLLTRDVNSQDDSDDDDGTEGEYLNSPTFPKQKNRIIFYKVSLAGSTCSWRGGRFGESVRCQPGEVAAGACGSGAQAQCGERAKSV